MFYTICNKCGKKIIQGSRCNCRHRVYDREFRNKDNAKFYNSKPWKRIRDLCKLKSNGLDLFELEINKRIVLGSLAHHIEELEENKDRALDIYNLIWVSSKTHRYIHEQYKKDKEGMQKILFEIIKKYF